MAKELKIKQVNAECAELYVGEDDEYNVFLCRQLKNEPVQIVRLWRVRFHCPSTEEELKDGLGIIERVVYVMAPSPEDAESQASCTLDRRDDGEPQYITAYIERVPFCLRGWSGREF